MKVEQAHIQSIITENLEQPEHKPITLEKLLSEEEGIPIDLGELFSQIVNRLNGLSIEETAFSSEPSENKNHIQQSQSTDYRLCKEFGKLPSEIRKESAKDIQQFIVILNELDRQAEEERQKARAIDANLCPLLSLQLLLENAYNGNVTLGLYDTGDRAATKELNVGRGKWQKVEVKVGAKHSDTFNWIDSDFDWTAIKRLGLTAGSRELVREASGLTTYTSADADTQPQEKVPAAKTLTV